MCFGGHPCCRFLVYKTKGWTSCSGRPLAAPWSADAKQSCNKNEGSLLLHMLRVLLFIYLFLVNDVTDEHSQSLWGTLLYLLHFLFQRINFETCQVLMKRPRACCHEGWARAPKSACTGCLHLGKTHDKQERAWQ